MMEPVIETRNLTKTFGRVKAVEGLNLVIYRGEIFGLVGPDGAGKTTTLRVLASVMAPSSGTAIVGGYNVLTQAEEVKRIVGYMPQHFALYGDLTVMENLNFFADLFGVPQGIREERVRRLLRFARLENFLNRRASQLSGGMQKKLALACALIHNPQILLLDEPTTGVDPVSRREFWELLTELHLQKATIVISTCYMDEAERCSRVGFMHQGRLLVCSEPSQIKEMVPKEVLEVFPSDVKRTKEILRGARGIGGLQTYGDMLHVFVDSAQQQAPEIKRLLESNGVMVQSIKPVPPRLEDAFAFLLARQ
ncbi:MAG: ABC transporter ATP-binding protein [Anaerolineae bacterium]|nr:ABC transporter ATP-binding protein [Anaerolineae bacterium]MDW8101711.1 ABC transporter ATP-binding protein [Anaerolineae bacterium]